MPRWCRSSARAVRMAASLVVLHRCGRGLAFAPARPRTPAPHRAPRPSPTPLRLGLEDLVFDAQSVGAALANTVLAAPSGPSSSAEALRSIGVLYAAGLATSCSPCALGLLPLTVSYISAAANERRDRRTLLPTLAFAAGLAAVFTALGVSASALGGVFGGGGSGGDPAGTLLLGALGSLVSVAMGLQLLELVRLPLPSLDFKFRPAAVASGGGAGGGSLFDKDGGLVLDGLQRDGGEGARGGEDAAESDEWSALLRTCLLGGTSALVASPCATPVLAALLAYLASASSAAASAGDLGRGAAWMLAYTVGYSTPLLAVGATGGQALVALQRGRDGDGGAGAALGRWVTPLTGGVLIAFGMNGFLVALLGDPSLAGLAPIIE